MFGVEFWRAASFVAVGIAASVVLSGSCRGALLIDGFDVLAEAISPAQENVPVVSNGVGGLGARRELRIANVQANPIATLDSGVSAPSSLTGVMVDLAPEFVGGTPIAAMQMTYDEFGFVDLTQGGINDALAFDFASLSGPSTPAFLRVLVWDDSAQKSFFSVIEPLQMSSEPFVLSMPFKSFVPRGGGSEVANFAAVNLVMVEIYANGYFGKPVEEGWRFQIDQIRAVSVPEPQFTAFFVAAAYGWPSCRRLFLRR